MKHLNRIFLLTMIAFAFILGGCDKTELYDVTIPPAKAHFVGTETQIYPVLTDTVSSYTITVGTTDVTQADRTVTYKISSPSGAVAGTQYTTNTNGTVTIPAGQSRADINIQGIFSEYAAGRKDTLIFTLATPSIEIASFQDTLTLFIAGPSTSGCSESVVTLNDFLGAYDNTIETLATNPPYGPYTTSISSVTSTGSTTATVVVENIWDNGWGPITFLLDWTDPQNRTAIVVPQDAIPGSDAGDLNPLYAGQTIAVKVPAANLSSTPGTYSYCDQTFTLKMQLGVTALGFFDALYTVNLAR